jgi:hypothetical protein
MRILVGIDGSDGYFLPSQSRNRSYRGTFRHSFVRRLSTDLYVDGPRALGGGLMNAVSEGHDFILGRRRPGVNNPILLAGYSRGAAGVVEIANRLRSRKVEVQAMLLFDCVDRHVWVNAEYIPENVRNVLHVVRSLGSGSRNSFGNAGRHPHHSTRYEEYSFHCTHAAMGGMPYSPSPEESEDDFIVESYPDGQTRVTYRQDSIGADRVWYSVQKFIALHGF